MCIDPDSVIYVSNAFIPNYDCINDEFIPVMEGIDSDKYERWVLDRWGNMIWHMDDIDEGWNGIVLGGSQLCQMDTCVWKLKCNNLLDKHHDLIGRVSLIR